MRLTDASPDEAKIKAFLKDVNVLLQKHDMMLGEGLYCLAQLSAVGIADSRSVSNCFEMYMATLIEALKILTKNSDIDIDFWSEAPVDKNTAN